MAWYNPLTWPKYIKRVVGGTKKHHPEVIPFFNQFDTEMGALAIELGKVALADLKTGSVPVLAADISARALAQGLPIISELVFNVARVLIFNQQTQAANALTEAVITPAG